MRTIIALVFSALSATGLAAQTQVQGLRMWQAPDHTRLVFDLSAPVEHTVFTLDSPPRIVIDLEQARLGQALPDLNVQGTRLAGVRSAPRNGKDLRVVLDLKQKLRPKSFLLKPYEDYGHRLVIDLQHGGDRGPSKAAVPTRSSGPREIVIAIDAGHGGEDPGAHGRHGTREKDVVLAIGRKLARLVRDEPGMRPVLIRDGDYYVSLRERMDQARRHQADLFVSIHADAFRDARASGSSVYTLSRRGASDEAARWLAEQENSADLIGGGVSLDDKDDLLASVLLDLSQTASIEASVDVAGSILKALKRVGRVHKRSVQQARFVVLKSPDIPSVLVETAFISNPAEERKLQSPRHQQRVARAILNGVRNYFVRNTPPGTRLVQKHVIQRGDTLSEIAQRYRVSLRRLRAVNELSGDRLLVGQTLRIPLGSGG